MNESPFQAILAEMIGKDGHFIVIKDATVWNLMASIAHPRAYPGAYLGRIFFCVGKCNLRLARSVQTPETIIDIYLEHPNALDQINNWLKSI